MPDEILGYQLVFADGDVSPVYSERAIAEGTATKHDPKPKIRVVYKEPAEAATDE